MKTAFDIFTQNIGPASMYFGILFFAYRYGVGMGAAVGTACGIVATLWTDDIVSLGVMCFVGVLAGAFRSLGKLGACTGYLCGIYLLGSLYNPALLADTHRVSVLYATLLFLILPKRHSYRCDYGQKRTGLAVSDPLKIIATALETVATKEF